MALIKQMSNNQLVFVVVLGLAIISGFVQILDATTTTMLLVGGGLVIGYMNIKKGESLPFLVASLVLAGGAAALAIIPAVGGIIQTIFTQVALVTLPAALLVALLVVYKKMRT